MTTADRKVVERFQAALARDASYDDAAKREWELAGRQLLKLVAKRLGLRGGKVWFCKGGIAVSGEVILEHPDLWVQLDQGGPDLGLMYRTRSHAAPWRPNPSEAKDGGNQWLPWRRLNDFDRALELLARAGGLPLPEAA